MKKQKKIKSLLACLPLALAFLIAPLTSQAQIAGYNLILVHGFVIEDIVTPPSYADLLARRKVSDYWQARAEGYLNWSGKKRIEGGIATDVYNQALTLAQNGTCNAGCVVLTHSTGDLVLRYFLANQAAWLQSAGYPPLNIVATLDFAGAGGGTGLADVAVGTVSGGSFLADQIWAVEMMWGLDLGSMTLGQMGVINDLATSKARSLANFPMSTPRLRISVDGTGNLLEIGMGQVRTITKTILIGSDDTVVPAHSTCGSSSPWAYESCSSNVDYEGKQGWEPAPSSYMPNHFPIVMAHDYDHFQITQDVHKGKAAFVQNNFNANGLQVSLTEWWHVVTAPWWQPWVNTGTWQYIGQSDYKSLSKVVYQQLND